MALHPEAAAWLDGQARLGLPSKSQWTIAEVRARYAEQSKAWAGEPPPVAVEQTPVGRLYGTGKGLLVYAHGGRFISGGAETHDALCRHLAAASGCGVLLVDYRLAPEHRFPAALDDVRAARDWALLQSSQVALAGDSAGGSLAAAAALDRPSDIRALALFYPMLDATLSRPSHTEFRTGPGPSGDDMRLGYDLYLPDGADRRDPAISPLFAEGPLPPMWVLTVEYDSLRDEGLEFARKHGAAYIHLDGWIHGILTLPGRFAIARNAIDDAARWLSTAIEVG